MTKIYKSVTVTREEIDKVLCDRCGKEIIDQMYNAFDCHWFKCMFGEAYPEGGAGKEYLLDLCENCSKDAISILREHGFRVLLRGWST